jgi:hypothetical protein
MKKNRSLGATTLALASLEDECQTKEERGSDIITSAVYNPPAGINPWAFVSPSPELRNSGLSNMNYTVSNAIPATVYSAAQVAQPMTGGL